MVTRGGRDSSSKRQRDSQKLRIKINMDKGEKRKKKLVQLEKVSFYADEEIVAFRSNLPNIIQLENGRTRA